MARGYLQYRLVGNYRLPRAGGTSGMDAMPAQIIATGPYRYTRYPMYPRPPIFMVGLVPYVLVVVRSSSCWTSCSRHVVPATGSDPTRGGSKGFRR